MLRVARDQSRGVNRLEDLRRATRYVEQAKARSPNLAEIAFIEGMLDKVQARFVEADKHFQNALRDDPDDPLTAAESAHVKMFLGRLDEAYRQVESIDVAAADAAFLAGETALIAGHPDRALTYFDWAVSGNPEIPRNPAWRAVALWRLDRKAEAHEAAVKSQKLEPPYLPYWMAQRGNLADKRYRDARDLCVEDFKQALAYTAMN
jgi:tetratricopeptide (TPR) repeat protein